jgi:hypothetical protein
VSGSVATLIAVLGCVGTVVGALSAFLAYRLTRTSAGNSALKDQVLNMVRTDVNFKEQVMNMVRADNQPNAERAAVMATELAKVRDTIQVMTSEVRENTTTIRSLTDRTVALETKVDVFWKNVALNLAQILHSPNPARAHVDALLEKLMAELKGEEGELLTPDEREELRRLLAYMAQHHHGDPSDFPIYPSDQVSAAILLETMDLTGSMP